MDYSQPVAGFSIGTMVTQIAVMAVDTIGTAVLMIYRTVVRVTATMQRGGDANLVVRCYAGAFGLGPTGTSARHEGGFPAGVF